MEEQNGNLAHAIDDLIDALDKADAELDRAKLACEKTEDGQVQDGMVLELLIEIAALLENVQARIKSKK